MHGLLHSVDEGLGFWVLVKGLGFRIFGALLWGKGGGTVNDINPALP